LLSPASGVEDTDGGHRAWIVLKSFVFAYRGEFMAKGFEEPVRVYEVSWRA
jgi:hypothetical protein